MRVGENARLAVWVVALGLPAACVFEESTYQGGGRRDQRTAFVQPRPDEDAGFDDDAGEEDAAFVEDAALE